MARKKDRLFFFYDELRRMHMTYAPDLRFSQMMYMIFGTEDIFYFEEDKVLKRVKEYFGEEE